MLFLALAAIVVSAQPGQIMAGTAFEHFAAQTDRSCPSLHLRMITPGDLSGKQEAFENQLPPPLKKRLAVENRANVQCVGRDGLSCSTGETLDAMARTKMLRSFSIFACSHPQP